MSIDDVQDLAPRVQYEALAAQTEFTVPFPFFEDGDLVVDVDGVTKTLTTDYTVTGAGEDAGGELTFVVAPGAGAIVTIYRDIPVERTSDFQQNGPMSSASLNNELDRITMVQQQLESQIGRALRLPISGEATNADAELSPIANWLGKYVRIDANGIPEPADIVTGTQSQSSIAALLNPQTAEESAGGITPTNYIYDTTPYGHIFRYMSSVQIADVLAATEAQDVTAAFTTALSLANDVIVPAGRYRTDSMITIPDGKRLRLSQGTIVVRSSAASSTDPVIFIKGTRASLTGGHVATEKASPSGIVVCGHLDNTVNYNAEGWSFTDCDVTGLNTAGNLGVVVPSGQVTNAVSNYFGRISGIRIRGADRGLLLAEYANAHNITDVQFWDCRTACLELRGAYANNVKGMFMHTGAASGVIAVLLSNKTVSTQESSHNIVEAWTAETAGALDQSLVIQSGASGNTIIGNSNVAGGFTISNRSNFVMLDGTMRCGTSMEGDAFQADTRFIVANGTTAARKGFIESNNGAAVLAVDATLTLTTRVNSGALIIRNASDGGSAVVLVDSVTGADVILDPDNFITVGADPGAGSSQFWVEADGTSTRITNRYATNKFVDVLSLAVAGLS